MHMHNAWLLGKTDWLIHLPSDYFVQPKYLLIFCGTLKLTEISYNGDVNNFDFHSFLFATSYLMINDSFLLQHLKTSGTVNFHENDTILPCLYALLTLNFDLPWTKSWFESKFTFYNNNFVSSISQLSYQAFCCRFLNFELCHFYNDFLRCANCLQTCEICLEHDSTYYCHFDVELSRFNLPQILRNSDRLHETLIWMTNFSKFFLLLSHTTNVLLHTLYPSCTNVIFIVLHTTVNLCLLHSTR